MANKKTNNGTNSLKRKIDFESKQNAVGFFSVLLKVDIRIKINFSIRQKKKKSKYEFLWKLIKSLFLVLRIISFFIK